MLHTGGVSALSWSGECFENINKENSNAMDLATLLKTFRNGLIAHGEYAKAREVARWMEEDQQCVNEHQVGVGGGTQSGNDGDTTRVSMEDEEEESNLRGGIDGEQMDSTEAEVESNFSGDIEEQKKDSSESEVESNFSEEVEHQRADSTEAGVESNFSGEVDEERVNAIGEHVSVEYLW